MKLIVTEEGHNIRLGLPTRLILNRATVFAACKKARKHGATITYHQAFTLVEALHTYRKTHPEWVLVEVTGAKGEYVKVKL